MSALFESILVQLGVDVQDAKAKKKRRGFDILCACGGSATGVLRAGSGKTKSVGVGVGECSKIGRPSASLSGWIGLGVVCR